MLLLSLLSRPPIRPRQTNSTNPNLPITSFFWGLPRRCKWQGVLSAASLWLQKETTKRDHKNEIAVCDLIRPQTAISFLLSLFEIISTWLIFNHTWRYKSRVTGRDWSHATKSDHFGDLPVKRWKRWYLPVDKMWRELFYSQNIAQIIMVSRQNEKHHWSI